MGALTSPSKPPAPKRQKKGGDGGTSSQAIELTESQAVESSSDHEDALIGGEDYAVDEEQELEQLQLQIDNSMYG